MLFQLRWNNLLSKKNRDVILNGAKDYYENDKERLKEQDRLKDRYISLSEEVKNEKQKYGRNRYHMSEEKKQTKRISKKLPWG